MRVVRGPGQVNRLAWARLGLLASLAAVSAAPAPGDDQGACRGSEPACAARELTSSPAMIQRGRPSVSRANLQQETQATPSPSENDYRRVDGIGGWGGWCTCPDGQRYDVGDNGDGCGSLACEGGAPGQCSKVEEVDRKGMKVTCAAASAAPPPPDAWTKHAGANCYPGSGASAVAGVSSPLEGNYTVECCQGACAAQPGCEGIVMPRTGSQCFLRRDVSLKSCQQGTGYDAFTLTPGSRPDPLPVTPPPTTAPPQSENDYRKVDGVGGWGGWCACPDGQRYDVGDNGDGCGSLACEGGAPGECRKVEEAGRKGMKVTCAQAALKPTSSPDPEAPCSCLAFSEWPSIDGGVTVTCGDCAALVLAAPYASRCDKFCESFGHVCAAAADVVAESCQVQNSHRCDEEIGGASGMLCTCHLP